ncbi:hypothetical protein CASFOL_009291 [Castilleja foliolosa]|uniref:Glycine--tRNA ligase n=1 Tax=Castilleja foliolosa TaxID=1961234 RepID=A0ABD3DYU1_9LAMI
MAHYAADCWDAEIESSYGWIECVGIADRSAFDLQAHTEKSGVPLVAYEKFTEPRIVEKLVIILDKRELGLAFKGDQKMVVEALEEMDENEAMIMKVTLEAMGEADLHVFALDKVVVIKKNMVSISKMKKKEHQRVFTPSVIEPSFGIGRILYCLYEHSFYTRPSKDSDEQLNVFRFPPLVAPIKCAVFPIVQNQHYNETVERISKSLTALGISYKIDTTGTSIGKSTTKKQADTDGIYRWNIFHRQRDDLSDVIGPIIGPNISIGEQQQQQQHDHQSMYEIGMMNHEHQGMGSHLGSRANLNLHMAHNLLPTKREVTNLYWNVEDRNPSAKRFMSENEDDHQMGQITPQQNQQTMMGNIGVDRVFEQQGYQVQGMN